MSDAVKAGLLLLGSNVFMTAAWYGHLRAPGLKLWQAILVSWGIAFVEYCLMIPANRIGYRALSAYQLKVLQEVITLVVFMVFAFLVLGARPQGRHALAFALILGAVALVFH